MEPSKCDWYEMVGDGSDSRVLRGGLRGFNGF